MPVTAADKDDRIIEAGSSLMLRYGYRNVTMGDIALACRISRPTLYKSFPNKEAIIEGILARQFADGLARTQGLAGSGGSLEDRLTSFFAVWVIEPSVPAFAAPTGRDLLSNVASYVPEAVERHYQGMTGQLAKLLEPEAGRCIPLSGDDLAHLLIVTVRGLKATSESLAELERSVRNVVMFTVAATRERADR